MCHRSLRCIECHSTLLPGSYKLGSDAGALVCTHHLTRPALAVKNGRPDLSTKPVVVQSTRIGRSATHNALASERNQGRTPSPVSTANDTDSVNHLSPVPTNKTDSLENTNDTDSGDKENIRSSSPPNPFDESDKEEDEQVKVEGTQPPVKSKTNGDLPSTPVSQHEGVLRPVPAPRRIAEPAPPPRPSPRVKLPRSADALAAGA